MTANNRALVAVDEQPEASTPNGRVPGGRFGPGNRISRGRPRQSITRELRQVCDVRDIALFLTSLVSDEKAPYRERVLAATTILDRLFGKPVSTAVHVSANNILPPNWNSLSATERASYLDSGMLSTHESYEETDNDEQ